MQAAAWFAIETELRNKNCIFNENHLRNERVLIIWISVLSEHVYIFFITSTFRVNDCYATIRSVNNNDEKILKWFCEEKMHGLLTCRVSVISILFFFLSLKCKTQINANIHSERGIVFVFFYDSECDTFSLSQCIMSYGGLRMRLFRSAFSFRFFPRTLS